MTKDDALAKRIKKLEYLTNMQATVRSYYAARLRWITRAVNVFILVTSVLLALAIFADVELIRRTFGIPAPTFEVARGWLAVLNFLAVVLVLYFRPADAADRQRNARRHYTEVRRRFDSLAKDPDAAKEEVDSLEQRYLDDAHFPDVPSRLFLIYRARHLFNIELNKAVADNPTARLRKLRRQLRKRTYEPPDRLA